MTVHTATTPTLPDLTASELADGLRRRSFSCREVMQSALHRIHALNPVFNAIVNMAPDEKLLAEADAADAELANGLHGIPMVVKDFADVVGFPTTKGCELLASHMPTSDSIMTARMKAAGCIVIGKTTTPEFGLGSHTFSTLWGVTRNAWDPAVSAGGSSGGAAVSPWRSACSPLPTARTEWVRCGTPPGGPRVRDAPFPGEGAPGRHVGRLDRPPVE